MTQRRKINTQKNKHPKSLFGIFNEGKEKFWRNDFDVSKIQKVLFSQKLD
jgi:hypothetical protein